MCSGLLVKGDLKPFPWELRLCRTFWLGDLVWSGVCAAFGRVELASLGMRRDWLRSLVLPECRGVGRCVSKNPILMLGCFLQVVLCLCWGVGEGVLASYLGPGEGFLWLLLQGHTPRRANNLPTVCPQMFFKSLFHTIYFWVVCLTSFLKQDSDLRLLSQPSLLNCKPQALWPTCCKNSLNSTSLIFQAIAVGKCFPCAFPCVVLSLLCFSWPWLTPSEGPVMFLP